MLTQLTTVKTRLGIAPADMADDLLLTNFIAGLSGRFERECNRTFGIGYGINFDFRGDEMNVRPDRCPVVSVASFWSKATEALGWVVESPTPDYLIGQQKNVIELAAPLGSSVGLGRVVYTGGYVLPGTTPGTGETALPSEVEQACVEQCAYVYQNRARLGVASMSAEGGSVQQFGNLDLLPSVRAVLEEVRKVDLLS
jgi:hypothetical protein